VTVGVVLNIDVVVSDDEEADDEEADDETDNNQHTSDS